MADHAEVQYSTADGNDYREHEATYELFLQLMKWGLILVVAILLFMFFFVA